MERLRVLRPRPLSAAAALAGVVAAWDRFWFRPEPASTLALVRVAFGIVTLVWALLLLPDAGAFFAPGGLTAGDPRFAVVVAVLPVAALAVAVGFRTRAACAVVLFALVWLHRVDPLLWNSGDVLLRHLALFLTLSPAGDVLSVDAWRRNRATFADLPARAPWALRLVQVHLALVYVVTVVAKLHGWSWRHGEAVSYVLRIPEDARFALPVSLAASPGWARALTYGTLAVEAAIPLLVWNRRARPVVLALGAGLHLAIEATLRVGPFSWVVLVAYLAFVPPEASARLVARVTALLSGGRQVAAGATRAA